MATSGDLESRIEPIEYLARSPSRLRVLDAIADCPRSRTELKDSTDVSRVTLSRMLSNFEDRGWIDRTNGEYTVTAEGAYVAEEVGQLLGNLATLDHLDGAMSWLPVEAFTFDLARLRDADVSTADWGDHTGQIRAVVDSLEGGTCIRATASGVSRDVLAALRTATVEDGATLEAVLDQTALEIVRGDPELARQVRDMQAQAGVDVRAYAGPAEPLLMVTVCDETVILCGHDPDGPPPGTLETTDEQVRDWAASYIDEIRSAASPVDPASVTD